MEQLSADPNVEAELQTQLQEDIDRKIEETIATFEEGHFTDEEQKELEIAVMRLHAQGKNFSDKPECQKMIDDISCYRVLKMPRILQALMYLLGMGREDICEPESNLFFWKKAN